MELLLNAPSQKPAGFMIPIPQYPLYTATISEYNAEKVIQTTSKNVKEEESARDLFIQPV